jgi:signal transduction histidine kinase
MADIDIRKTKRRLEASEKQIAGLLQSYRSILEFIDKMEHLVQFQDRIDIPYRLDQIWDVFLGEIRNLIRLEVCALFLVQDETKEFVLHSVIPGDRVSICEKELAFQIECGMFSWVINRRKPALVPSLVFKDQKSIILLPLTTVKRTMGAVLIVTPVEEHAVTQENMKLFTMLARQCSLVMENTLLYDDLRTEHESLQHAQAQIIRAEKLAAMGRLTAGAFHEILNPLNIISGHLQLLSKGNRLPASLAKRVGTMCEQAQRIAKVVKGLLQFSRLSPRKTGEVQVNDLIERVLSLVAYERKFDGIQVVKGLDYALPAVMGDEEKISQVFFNLLSNARDAMPAGGTLTVTTRMVAQALLPSGPTDAVEVAFRDTGCGIPPERMSKIFDPFFTTKETGNGTGLGLSISYGIIEDHGGTIRVESAEDRGTCFAVCIPVGRAFTA